MADSQQNGMSMAEPPHSIAQASVDEKGRLKLPAEFLDRVERFEFNRYWAQLVVREPVARPRLALRSHGREVEFGRYLTDRQRLELARVLESRLGAH